MIGVPKPRKEDRKKKEAEQKASLKSYRASQYELAMIRDNGQCVFHHFLHNMSIPGNDVHHVYGRANKSGKDIWKEDYKYLLTTCRECHPQPIKDNKPSSDMMWIEAVRIKANSTPINKEFKSGIS